MAERQRSRRVTRLSESALAEPVAPESNPGGALLTIEELRRSTSELEVRQRRWEAERTRFESKRRRRDLIPVGTHPPSSEDTA